MAYALDIDLDLFLKTYFENTIPESKYISSSELNLLIPLQVMSDMNLQIKLCPILMDIVWHGVYGMWK